MQQKNFYIQTIKKYSKNLLCDLSWTMFQSEFVDAVVAEINWC